MSTLANIRFGMILWRTAMRSCPTHGFIIYGKPGVDPEVWVHTGTKTTMLHLRDPDEIEDDRRRAAHRSLRRRRFWRLLAATGQAEVATPLRY